MSVKSESSKYSEIFSKSLTSEQRDAKRLINSKVITVIRGAAGTGKTFVGINYAIEAFEMRKKLGNGIEKLIITRATVMLKKDQNQGFLPGDIKEKLDPWMQPIYDNILKLFGWQNGETKQTKLDKMIQEKIIEIVPLAYVQGRTFENAVIIVDECQNISNEEFKMLFTRIGKGSKMILCGDLKQQILQEESGIKFITYLVESKKTDKVGIIELTENHRDPIVQELLELYENENK